MGYEVRGVIAGTALARVIAGEFGRGTRAVDLEQGFALVPYTAGPTITFWATTANRSIRSIVSAPG